MARRIQLPLTRELSRTLHAGDQVLLSGTIYTSRDAGHKRMCEALARGEELPFDPTDATIYYVGPHSGKTGAGHRFCRPYHQRSNGRLCAPDDGSRRQRNDRKRRPSAGGY